ncbi:MAG: SBBP repeat-containing protein, partial [Methanoregulaceae archaeon]|nr:SBBP repeat-containing protein [Methanoregulaceae archaeon]
EEEWVTDVPMYSTVRYDGLYDGITLVYHGGKGVLKREFVIEPGTNPSVIKMEYAGQDSLVLDESGAILIGTPAGTLIETAPLCYQVVDGQQVTIPCGYVISGNLVTFSIGSYDPELPLIIDPVIDFSTYFGGNNDDKGVDIGLDDLGYIYIIGSTKSTNLPLPNAPVYQEDLNGTWDIFVAKMKPDGSDLIYSTYIGGNSTDLAGGLAVNNVSGEVIFTGSTESKNYPSPLPLADVYGGNTDAVVTRLNATGDGIVWSRIIYGNKTDVGTSIALDNPGSDYVVVAGYTSSDNLTGSWGFPGSLSGATDAFIIIFDAAGNQQARRYLGGENYDYAYGVAWEHTAPYYIWVTGSTKSLLFPTSTPAFRKNNAGQIDAFIAKLNYGDLSIASSTYLGGTEDDIGSSIAVDFYGYPYITGYTESPVNPINLFPITPGAFQSTYAGGKYDAFITKMNPALTQLNYSTYLGGNFEDRGYDIAVDNNSAAYVTGFTISDNFPKKYPLQATRDGLVSDVFLTIMNETGEGLLFSTYLGGTYYDEGHGIAITDDGLNITLTGFTESINFPLANPYQGYLAGFPPVYRQLY